MRFNNFILYNDVSKFILHNSGIRLTIMPTKYESILITYAKRNFYFVSSLSFNLMITNKFTLINDLYIISEIQPSVAT
jgi:hypothetical protein